MLDFLTLSGELPPNPLQNRPDPTRRSEGVPLTLVESVS